MNATRNIYMIHDDGTAELLIGRKKVLLDADDIALVSEFQWTIGSHGYVTHGTGKHQILMHRLLTGNNNGSCVDHINRNKLDNRKENLRLCTTAQNAMNKERISDNPYKGICHTTDDCWQAQIAFEGKSIYLGKFTDPAMAAKAYDTAARLLYGEYAFLNFPESDEEIIVSIKRRRKLSLDEVNSVRLLYAEGMPINDIAQLYEHSYSAIYRIISHRTYREDKNLE